MIQLALPSGLFNIHSETSYPFQILRTELPDQIVGDDQDGEQFPYYRLVDRRAVKHSVEAWDLFDPLDCPEPLKKLAIRDFQINEFRNVMEAMPPTMTVEDVVIDTLYEMNDRLFQAGTTHGAIVRMKNSIIMLDDQALHFYFAKVINKRTGHITYKGALGAILPHKILKCQFTGDGNFVRKFYDYR